MHRGGSIHWWFYKQVSISLLDRSTMTLHHILAQSPDVDVKILIKGNESSWVRIRHRGIVDLGVERLPVVLAVPLPLEHVQSQVEAGQDASRSSPAIDDVELDASASPATPPKFGPYVAAWEGVVVLYPLHGNALVLDCNCVSNYLTVSGIRN